MSGSSPPPTTPRAHRRRHHHSPPTRVAASLWAFWAASRPWRLAVTARSHRLLLLARVLQQGRQIQVGQQRDVVIDRRIADLLQIGVHRQRILLQTHHVAEGSSCSSSGPRPDPPGSAAAGRTGCPCQSGAAGRGPSPR